LRVLRSQPVAGHGSSQPTLCWRDGAVLALCPDGALELLQFELGGELYDAATFKARYDGRNLALENGAVE
jgi:hypothetical protein